MSRIFGDHGEFGPQRSPPWPPRRFRIGGRGRRGVRPVWLDWRPNRGSGRDRGVGPAPGRGREGSPRGGDRAVESTAGVQWVPWRWGNWVGGGDGWWGLDVLIAVWGMVGGEILSRYVQIVRSVSGFEQGPGGWAPRPAGGGPPLGSRRSRSVPAGLPGPSPGTFRPTWRAEGHGQKGVWCGDLPRCHRLSAAQGLVPGLRWRGPHG